MSFDPGPAAAALYAARLARRACGPLPAGVAPTDEATAAAVQVGLAALMGVVRPAGFKIGATAPVMQAYLGLAGPAAGFMAAAHVHASGVTLDQAAYMGPGAECELCVRLARDLPPGPCAPDTAAAAVGTVSAAIEIVENRYGPPPAGDLVAIGTPTLIADQVYHAEAVVGAADAGWRGRDLGRISGRILVDRMVRGEGRGEALLGHPMAALAWLAGSAVAAAFGGLRAGQVVMLGSVTPPIWLDGPCEVVVRFDGLADAVVRLV